MESITDITVEFNAKKLDYYEALGQTFLDNVGEANPRKIQIPDGDVELPDFGKEIDAMELEVLIYDIQSLAFQLNYLASIFWLNACGQGDGTQAVTIPSGGDGGLGGGDPSGSSSCSQQLGYIEVSYDGGSTWSTSWSGEVWVCPDQEVY